MTIAEISEETGIARNTLSRILNLPGWNVRSEHLDKLCAYFDCRIEELVEYIPDRQRGESAKKPDGR